MRGGPRVLSPDFGCEMSASIELKGVIKAYWKSFVPSKARGVPAACLRLEKPSLTNRRGERTGGAFCSLRTVRAATAFLLDNEPSEGDKPICWASQTVKVTVSATANPVHLLLRSLVALVFAKCTDRALACLMPREFYAKVALS